MLNPPPFAKSALVVAHADDEILFFSSIVDKVDAVFICFIGSVNKPYRRERRKCVLEQYPLNNIVALDLDAPGVDGCVEADETEKTPFGLKINNQTAEEAYEKTYAEVIGALRDQLRGYEFVYTHNPWGEYAHPMHVQINCVVESLAVELGFRAMFSNYISVDAMKLAKPYLLYGKYPEPFSLPTNVGLAHQIRDLYMRENCWTAYRHLIWPEYESFNSLVSTHDSENSAYRYLFMFNLLPGFYKDTMPKWFENWALADVIS